METAVLAVLNILSAWNLPPGNKQSPKYLPRKTLFHRINNRREQNFRLTTQFFSPFALDAKQMNNNWRGKQGPKVEAVMRASLVSLRFQIAPPSWLHKIALAGLSLQHPHFDH